MRAPFNAADIVRARARWRTTLPLRVRTRPRWRRRRSGRVRRAPAAFAFARGERVRPSLLHCGGVFAAQGLLCRRCRNDGVGQRGTTGKAAAPAATPHEEAVAFRRSPSHARHDRTTETSPELTHESLLLQGARISITCRHEQGRPEHY